MDYYKQDLGKLWSGTQVRNSYQHIHFEHEFMPFSLPEIRSSSDTVLELGSSFGQCYRSLMSEGIDLGPRYTGIDVSEEGVGYSANMFPQATWIQGDFLTTEFGQTFDFLVERNAIHHMPSPLECVAKAVNLTDKAISMHMRVRTWHSTLSDIEKGYFVFRSDEGEIKGRFFYNLINLFELVDHILSLERIAQVSIRLIPHTTTKSVDGLEIPLDVQDPKEETYYCKCVVTKGSAQKPRVRVQTRNLKPLVVDTLRRPASLTRFLGVRNQLLARNQKTS